jgi:putative ABC transport system ATP-binding protein
VSAVVEATGLVKRVRGRTGDHTILDGFDLSLTAGTVTGLVGPSLSGKTTLLSILAGWESADSGRVTWLAGPNPGWDDLTVIPQGFALLDELSVEENIRLSERAGGRAIDPARLSAVTEALGIGHLLGRFTSEISVGERQRTMAARALVGAPGCILADDPVAHQDERHAGNVLRLLRAAADGGAACLIATRTPALVDGVTDTIVHLAASRR